MYHDIKSYGAETKLRILTFMKQVKLSCTACRFTLRRETLIQGVKREKCEIDQSRTLVLKFGMHGTLPPFLLQALTVWSFETDSTLAFCLAPTTGQPSQRNAIDIVNYRTEYHFYYRNITVPTVLLWRNSTNVCVSYQSLLPEILSKACPCDTYL